MFAATPDDLAPRETLLSMSGLAFMEAIRDGTLPQPPIGRLLNYRVTEVGPGRVVFAGTPTFDHCNPMGTVHGGWYGTLLDSAMACAVMTLVPRGSVYTTLEYKVNLVRSIPLGTAIEAEGVGAARRPFHRRCGGRDPGGGGREALRHRVHDMPDHGELRWSCTPGSPPASRGRG